MSRRWFHSHCNGLEAQHILLNEGTEGSFLVRRSYSRRGQFVLSVRYSNSVKHIKIHGDGIFFDLDGGEKFETLTDLIEHYMTFPHVLKKQGGATLPLTIPIASPEPTNERWFHGQLSKSEAECLILEKGRFGSYLVRESQSELGNYVLAVNVDERVTEIKIRFNGESYDIGGGKDFFSLNDLIKFYSFNPMVDEHGMVIHLFNPINVTRINVGGIVDRVFKLKNQKYQHYTFGTGGFWEEFDVLQRWETKRELTKDIGFLDVNKPKNRYLNIVPYDHSRIVLNDCDINVPGSDYINANMINLDRYSLFDNHKTRKYIVTQGCLPNTISDFWKMIWQEDSRVIVMITKLIEKSKDKCTKYWPDVGQLCEYGKITILSIGEHASKHIIIRMFDISQSNCKHRRIYQYQFKGWPDHGVPPDAGPFLDFQFAVNVGQFNIESVSGFSHPITVHCSGGLGRTGIFVVIDLLLHYINRQGLDCEVDIQRTTHLLRYFRSGLVMSEAQYQFIYTAFNHFVQTICTRILAQKKTEMFGREYLNIKYSDELEKVVGKKNVPPLNPSTAQRVIRNAISWNTYPSTDSPLISPTVDKSNVVDLLGNSRNVVNVSSPSSVSGYLNPSPSSPTVKAFKLHSYENVSYLPSSECDIGPPPTEVAPPPPQQ